MGATATAGNTAFRDYVTDGVPLSGANPVSKSQARAAFTAADTAILALEAELSTNRILGQVVTTALGTVATGTTLIPEDNTIPQITEGTQFLSRAITPKDAASLLEIEVTLFCAYSVTDIPIAVALFDGSTSAIAVGAAVPSADGKMCCISFKHTETSGDLLARTYTVRAGAGSAGTITVNGVGGAQRYGGVLSSRITIKEILSAV